MDKDQIINNRNRVVFTYRNSARKINEVDAKVLWVEIHYEMVFKTGVCSIEPLIKTDVLMPDDKLFWYHPCLNKDCTGRGFYQTDELREAIKSHKIVKGVKYCDGKEDWKYYSKPSGCSCMTTLRYEIKPFFK